MAPPVHNHGGDCVYDPDMPPWARRLESSVNRVLTHIEGEPGKTQTGLLTRVDRLEQSESGRDWWMKAAATAGLGGIATAIWAKISGGH